MHHSPEGPGQPLYLHHTLVVDLGQAPLRVDHFLAGRLAQLSRTKVQMAIREGFVKVNGELVRVSYLVKPGDQIEVFWPQPRVETSIVPEEMEIEVVYEDEAVVVVNKPAMLVVHPGHTHLQGTLVNGLAYHYGQLPARAGGEGRPGIVHRLDKGTSGLLVVGKTDQSLAHLAQQFFERTIQREYWALVWGTPQSQGTIALPLMRSPRDRRVIVPARSGDEGKHAVTHYQLVEPLGFVSLICCKLETGRTHQIRAHMAAIGHPLFGDQPYGGAIPRQGPPYASYRRFVANGLALLPHQALHAHALTFIHPTRGEQMAFSAPLPPAFEQLVERWRKCHRLQQWG